MNAENIAKTVIRTGHFFIQDYDFSIKLFTAITALVPFKCKLEMNYFNEGDWVIICPEILEDRHSCFWHGQGCNTQTEIANPTKWMDAWQHQHNPTWRK